MTQSTVMRDLEFPSLSESACMLTDEEWRAVNRSLYLTSRELDIVKQLLLGQTEAGIAVHLGISTNTVHTHLGRVYKKLAVRSAAGLILRVFNAYVHFIRIET